MTSAVRNPGGDQGQDPKNGTDPAPPDPVPPEFDLSRVPVHVACVMDGNGRWANAGDCPGPRGTERGRPPSSMW